MDRPIHCNPVSTQSGDLAWYPISDAVQGVLIGAAVGDSLGLPAEGLTPARIMANRWCTWRQRLIFGKGMISDDTEHTLFVAQSILRAPDDAKQFQCLLAHKLRWWLFSLPAGTGLATARAILKLWVGISPKKSGVFSAGNGPAMRAAIVGAPFRHDSGKIEEYVTASTRLTHTDPRALTGALAVAQLSGYLAQTGLRFDSSVVFHLLKELSREDAEWQDIVATMERCYAGREPVREFCGTLGLERGVTGYVYHTVPVAIYSLLLHDAKFEIALTEVLNCGGDADTTGAILGGMLGACGAETRIPKSWVTDIAEWPRSVHLLKRVAEQLNEMTGGRPFDRVPYCIAAIPFRNVFFLIIVLCHGFLRFLPSFIIRTIFP
jgi:ADP-ribosylglycohydrolase